MANNFPNNPPMNNPGWRRPNWNRSYFRPVYVVNTRTNYTISICTAANNERLRMQEIKGLANALPNQGSSSVSALQQRIDSYINQANNTLATYGCTGVGTGLYGTSGGLY